MQAIHMPAERDHGLRREQRRHLAPAPNRRIPVCDHVPAGRTLHLIDIENQAGGTELDAEAIARTLHEYAVVANVEASDHEVIGCNPALAIAVKSVADAARVVSRHGADGADLALLDEAKDLRWIAERYYRVVIGSGDHIFAPLADALLSMGVVVGIVCRRGSLSAALYATPGLTIHYLDPGLPGLRSA